jgi:branched-chain amino acid transport system permease protein
MIKTGRAFAEIGALCVFAALFLLLASENRYLLAAATLALIYAILSISLNWIWGLTGQFSMGQPGLMAIAAYSSAFVVMQWRWSFWEGAAFALALTSGISICLGTVALRFREMHFAIVTLAFTLLIVAVLNNWNLVGASGGMIAAYGMPQFPMLRGFGIDAEIYQEMFCVVFVVAVATLIGQVYLMQTRVGRAFLAIREDEMLAQSLGIAIRRYKVVAFVMSSLPAAFSGILYAPFLTFIYPQGFGFTLLINTILFVAVGGVGSLLGPVIGAILFGALPELLQMTGELRLAIYGLALIVITLFTPGGIIGWLELLHQYRRHRSDADVLRGTK